MKIDRGFIKWQPFNSLTTKKDIINSIKKEEETSIPTIYPEKQENLNKKIVDAYYSHNYVIITFYQYNKINTIKTKIIKINPSLNTIVLENNQTISFNQIKDIL